MANANANKKPQARKGSGSEQLPQGGAKQVNDAMAMAQPIPIPDFNPEPPQIQGDITGMDSLLFGPTLRPGEPITAGMPFGPGPSFVRGQNEDDNTWLRRVASTVANSPSATTRVKSLAARIARGV